MNNGAKQNVLKKANNFSQNRMIIENVKKPSQNFNASHGNPAMKDTTNDVLLTQRTHESNEMSYQYSAPADNIDERDRDEPLCVTDYVQDMYAHFRSREGETSVRPGFMDIQPHINEGMRGILVDWLVEVHLKFRLGAETLYLTINLIDRFLEKREVTRAKLQLVGVTCLLIAAKYEEIYPPELRELVYICDRAYTKEQIQDRAANRQTPYIASAALKTPNVPQNPTRQRPQVYEYYNNDKGAKALWLHIIIDDAVQNGLPLDQIHKTNKADIDPQWKDALAE